MPKIITMLRKKTRFFSYLALPVSHFGLTFPHPAITICYLLRDADMLESTLEKIAEKILALDEASLTSLWEKYRDRMEKFETTKEWEKSVIIFFIINAVRVKNQIFNERLLQKHGPPAPRKKTSKHKPDLKLVK